MRKRDVAHNVALLISADGDKRHRQVAAGAQRVDDVCLVLPPKRRGQYPVHRLGIARLLRPY